MGLLVTIIDLPLYTLILEGRVLNLPGGRDVGGGDPAGPPPGTPPLTMMGANICVLQTTN